MSPTLRALLHDKVSVVLDPTDAAASLVQLCDSRVRQSVRELLIGRAETLLNGASHHPSTDRVKVPAFDYDADQAAAADGQFTQVSTRACPMVGVPLMHASVPTCMPGRAMLT